MKKLSLTIFIIVLSFFNLLAQDKPVFVSQNYIDNGAMGPDEIITWRFNGYDFLSITPGISRPFTSSQIFKSKSNINFKNSQIFKNNLIPILNKKFSEKFLLDYQEYPECYKNNFLRNVNIDSVQISLDPEKIYFTFLWHNNWEDIMQSDQNNNSTICNIVFISSTISFKIDEINPYITRN